MLTVDPAYASYPLIDSSLEKEISPDLEIIRTKSSESFSIYKKVSKSKSIPYGGFANERKEISLKERVARFIRGNFFLPDPRKGWNKYALKAARELLQTSEIDAIITSSPPHSTQLIGRTLAKEFKLPWIADFRDPWTDIYFYKEFYPTFFADRYHRNWEKKILKEASLVITVGRSLQKLFQDKMLQDREKVKIIHNGYDPEDFQNIKAKKDSKFSITYVGTLADSYPLTSFLKAVGKLMSESRDIQLKFIGTISPKYLAQISALPAEQVSMIPYVEHNRAIEYMSHSNVLLLVIPSHFSSKSILTGKLFEYLAVERPILSLGPVDGDAAEIIRKSNAGTTIEAVQSDEIYNQLKDWQLKAPKIKANQDFNRKNLSALLAAHLDSLS